MWTTFEGDIVTLWYHDIIICAVGTKWEATANTGGREKEIRTEISGSIGKCKGRSEGVKYLSVDLSNHTLC